MPQLDVMMLFTQSFWLLLIFITFYFFVLKEFLLDISFTLKIRKKVIGSLRRVLEETRVNVLKDKLTSLKLLRRSLAIGNERLLSVTGKKLKESLENQNIFKRVER